MNDEVRGLRDLIPRAMDAQREATDARLKELNVELKSLKTLVGNRVGAAPSPAPAPAPSSSTFTARSPAPLSSSTSTPSDPSTPAASTSTATPLPPPSQARPNNRAAIPAWQMAASKKSAVDESRKVNGTGAGSGSVVEVATPT